MSTSDVQNIVGHLGAIVFVIGLIVASVGRSLDGEGPMTERTVKTCGWVVFACLVIVSAAIAGIQLACLAGSSPETRVALPAWVAVLAGIVYGVTMALFLIMAMWEGKPD